MCLSRSASSVDHLTIGRFQQAKQGWHVDKSVYKDLLVDLLSAFAELKECLVQLLLLRCHISYSAAIPARANISASASSAGASLAALALFLRSKLSQTSFQVPRVAALTVGPGAQPGVDLGPLIDDRAVAKVRRLVEDALARGARLVHGAVPGASRFVAPVVLAEVTAEMAIWREEIFGPVVAIRAVADEAAAVAAANDTDAGLCAYVMTRDLGRARRVVRQLAVGMVGVNEGLISTAQAPFGGVKASGYGREGSRHGLDDYLEYQYVMTTALDTP